jgi:uncharacterized membrane protein SirB2
MQQRYLVLLGTHMLLALLSPLLLSVRVWRTLRAATPAADRLFLPGYAIDGLLLAGGLALGWIIQQYPFVDAWLTAKLLALVAYVCAGHGALWSARSGRVRLGAWLVALALFLYMFGVAVSRSPGAGLF